MCAKKVLQKGVIGLVVLFFVCILPGAAVGRPYFVPLAGWLSRAVAGPTVIHSTYSPNRAYEAYVVDYPSIDPPNQSIFIQSSDEKKFVFVAQLVADVDSILEITWSPKGELVVFMTSNNLIVVLVPGFQVVKIPLDTQFARYSPGKFTTFGGGIPQYRVADIEFPELGVVDYRLAPVKKSGSAGLEPMREIRMAVMLADSPQPRSPSGFP